MVFKYFQTVNRQLEPESNNFSSEGDGNSEEDLSNEDLEARVLSEIIQEIWDEPDNNANESVETLGASKRNVSVSTPINTYHLDQNTNARLSITGAAGSSDRAHESGTVGASGRVGASDRVGASGRVSSSRRVGVSHRVDTGGGCIESGGSFRRMLQRASERTTSTSRTNRINSNGRRPFVPRHRHRRESSTITDINQLFSDCEGDRCSNADKDQDNRVVKQKRDRSNLRNVSYYLLYFDYIIVIYITRAISRQL